MAARLSFLCNREYVQKEKPGNSTGDEAAVCEHGYRVLSLWPPPIECGKSKALENYTIE